MGRWDENAGCWIGGEDPWAGALTAAQIGAAMTTIAPDMTLTLD